MTLVIDDFNPRRLVSANRRIHHMVRAEVSAYWRKLGHDVVVAEYGHADVGETWHHRVRLVVTLRWPDNRRRDGHNLYSYVIKPLVDGMVDARLLPDDDDDHLVGPDVRRDPERGPHRITVDVYDLTDPAPAATSTLAAGAATPKETT
jgi:hypothetical protein